MHYSSESQKAKIELCNKNQVHCLDKVLETLNYAKARERRRRCSLTCSLTKTQMTDHSMTTTNQLLTTTD